MNLLFFILFNFFLVLVSAFALFFLAFSLLHLTIAIRGWLLNKKEKKNEENI